MSKDKGYSREGFFGTIYHYDSKGHKIGESRPGLFGGYSNYDSHGHKTGTSAEKFFGGGFTHYDNKGQKIGSSDEGLFGGYTNRDASGRVTGTTDRSVFDIKSPDEIAATGSLYGSPLYPRGPSLDSTPAAPPPGFRRTLSPGKEPVEEAWIKGDLISSEDMPLLRDAGYDETDLEFMATGEFREALENAGVDPDYYDFDYS